MIITTNYSTHVHINIYDNNHLSVRCLNPVGDPVARTTASEGHRRLPADAATSVEEPRAGFAAQEWEGENSSPLTRMRVRSYDCRRRVPHPPARQETWSAWHQYEPRGLNGGTLDPAEAPMLVRRQRELETIRTLEWWRWQAVDSSGSPTF
jgi:hypothetical protein